MNKQDNWFDLSEKQLSSYSPKTKRNIVGAYSWQMEYLRIGTKSKEKTAKKYKSSISKFFHDQALRISARYEQFFGIKQSDFPTEKIDELLEIMFPISEDLLLQSAIRPLHTSGIQKSPADINSLATTPILIDTTLTNASIVAKLESMAKKITRVNDSSKMIIKDVIIKGIKNEDNIYTIRDSILDTGLNEYYDGRALTIARTESRLAYDAGSMLTLEKSSVQKFDIVGCIGTLGVPNEFGLMSSYGDQKESIGNCGILDIPINLWDAISAGHHPNHMGMAVSAEKL